jgi:hypothetical protein
MKADQLLQSAVQYGMELKADFGNDLRPHVQKQLQDIFASVAYVDLMASPISHLFDEGGREGIAEDINGAILGESYLFSSLTAGRFVSKKCGC